MKAILISIKPKWVAKILNSEKTFEIRKSMPKCKLPIDVYIYCTKERPLIVLEDVEKSAKLYGIDTNKKCVIASVGKRKPRTPCPYDLSGKVVAKFTLDWCESFRVIHKTEYENMTVHGWCITNKELGQYLGYKIGYAWQISNLEIFDKPRELNEFRKWHEIFESSEPTDILPDIKLTKAPQSWCYVEKL